MRESIIFGFSVIMAIKLSAQEPSRRNTAYAEMMGNGIILSANYERQLTKTPGVGVHLGIGLGGYGPAIPMGVKYLLEIGNQKSYLETGLGFTLAERGVWDTDHQNEPGSKKYKAALIPSVGYRYQARSGFICRINYTPVFTNWDNRPVYFGLSFGWRF